MQIQIRNDSVIITGYVNAIERNSKIMNSPQGKFVEQVKEKTFQRALDNAKNVDLLLNHDSNKKLGSTTEGNLKLVEDNIGLRAMATITDTEVMAKAKANKLKGWSFGFTTRTNGDTWEEGKDGIQKRTLNNINLLEVSILDNTKSPAYSGTSIESRDDEENTLTEFRSVEDATEVIDNSEKVEEREVLNYSDVENILKILKA